MRAADFQRDRGISSGPIRGRYETGRQPGGIPGDHRIGVVWHTQGSGKSLTMAFYAGAIVREPAMQNPTIVVLTDPQRPWTTNSSPLSPDAQDLLRQPPAQG